MVEGTGVTSRPPSRGSSAARFPPLWFLRSHRVPGKDCLPHMAGKCCLSPHSRSKHSPSEREQVTSGRSKLLKSALSFTLRQDREGCQPCAWRLLTRGTPCLRKLAPGHESLSRDTHPKCSMAHAQVKRVRECKGQGWVARWPPTLCKGHSAHRRLTGLPSLPFESA